MASPQGRAALQTFHALQASDLAAAMNDALKKVRVGPGDYSPELTSPDGPSTGGGIQAMQHLRLVPAQPGSPALVVGHANHAAGTAELRTYEHIDAIHRQRFHLELGLDRKQYDDFLTFAKQVFDALHLTTTVVGPPGPSLSAPAAVPRRVGVGPMAAAVALALLLALALGAWALLHAS